MLSIYKVIKWDIKKQIHTSTTFMSNFVYFKGKVSFFINSSNFKNWKCTFWPISTALCVAVLFILLNARTTTIIVTYDLTESSPRDHNGPKRFKIVYVLVNFSAKDSQVCLSLQWNHPFTYKSFKNSESRFLYTRKMLGCIAPVLLELMALDQRSQFNRFRVPLPDRPRTSGLRPICDCTRPAPRHF